MNFVKYFNAFTIGEYIVTGILFVFLGINYLYASYPKVFNDVPIVYFLMFVLQVSVFLILFLLAFIIYYQIKENKDFFQYDQIGSEYKIFKGKNQITYLTIFFIFIIFIHIVIQVSFNNLFRSTYYNTNLSLDWYEIYLIILLITMLFYLLPYLLVLVYNTMITKYQGTIDKNHLGIPVKALTTILNLIIFVIIAFINILFIIYVYFSYFFD